MLALEFATHGNKKYHLWYEDHAWLWLAWTGHQMSRTSRGVPTSTLPDPVVLGRSFTCLGVSPFIYKMGIINIVNISLDILRIKSGNYMWMNHVNSGVQNKYNWTSLIHRKIILRQSLANTYLNIFNYSDSLPCIYHLVFTLNWIYHHWASQRASTSTLLCRRQLEFT